MSSMYRRSLLFLLLPILPSFKAPAAAIFYSDQISFDAALTAAGVSTNLIDFETVPTAEYSTASGLTVNGINFVGPFSPYFLRVFPESGWGEHFAQDTGNTLAAVGEIDIKLPPDTRAFGANVGQSFVWATGGISAVGFRLSTGEQAFTATNPSRLFPFFGFVSDAPVSSLQIGFGASFITIDNVTFGPTAVPEPNTFWLLLPVAVLFLSLRSRPSDYCQPRTRKQT